MDDDVNKKPNKWAHGIGTAFATAAGYLTAAATLVGSALIAYDGMVYGRPDVAAGGLALFALGMELVGLSRKEDHILGVFKAGSLGKIFQQGDRMAVLGLGACAALGGGEVLHMIARHGVTAENLLSQGVWDSIMVDPAIYKVAANLTLYPAASVLDFHRVEEFAKKHKMEKAHRIVQAALLVGGAAMIMRFGELGKIYSARMFGRLNVGAGLVRIGQLSASDNDKDSEQTPAPQGQVIYAKLDTVEEPDYEIKSGAAEIITADSRPKALSVPAEKPRIK